MFLLGLLIGLLIGAVVGGLVVAWLVTSMERDSRRAGDVLDFTGARYSRPPSLSPPPMPPTPPPPYSEYRGG